MRHEWRTGVAASRRHGATSGVASALCTAASVFTGYRKIALDSGGKRILPRTGSGPRSPRGPCEYQRTGRRGKSFELHHAAGAVLGDSPRRIHSKRGQRANAHRSGFDRSAARDSHLERPSQGWAIPTEGMGVEKRAHRTHGVISGRRTLRANRARRMDRSDAAGYLTPRTPNHSSAGLYR